MFYIIKKQENSVKKYKKCCAEYCTHGHNTTSDKNGRISKTTRWIFKRNENSDSGEKSDLETSKISMALFLAILRKLVVAAQ